MNFSSIVGFAIAASVLGYAVHDAEGAEKVLLNHHAIMIVIGGTFAAACICFPINRVVKLGFLALKKIFGVGAINYELTIQEVIQVAKGYQTDPNYLKTAVGQLKNPFLKEGVQLIIDGMPDDQLQEILTTRIETSKRRYTAEVNMLKTMGRFPPAFGLLGTTFGMIALLNKLGSEDAQKIIGPAMAVGLVATLYGIALTNFIFIPISENLAALGADDYAQRRMIMEGIVMLKRKMHPMMVEERMKSYLLPSEREALSKKVNVA